MVVFFFYRDTSSSIYVWWQFILTSTKEKLSPFSQRLDFLFIDHGHSVPDEKNIEKQGSVM